MVADVAAQKKRTVFRFVSLVCFNSFRRDVFSKKGKAVENESALQLPLSGCMDLQRCCLALSRTKTCEETTLALPPPQPATQTTHIIGFALSSIISARPIFDISDG